MNYSAQDSPVPGHTRRPGDPHCRDPEALDDLVALPATLVREARPVYGEPVQLERLRQAAEAGLPVDAVKVLQAELKRFGVQRPSDFVNRIVSRATRQRRDRLNREESEVVLRVAAVMALAVYVWGEEPGAAVFLTHPHRMLGGAVPIEMALSEVGARHVEDILWGLHYGLPA